ncbi:hypothetical protein CSUB01_09842 [Colletotrichum sublineola]|uniref:Uncharacterized protein n=1 Tax=Colletotrichum sublineola TaxID=1173701 RepID=A0A066X5H5_COLSU|nr:hypothetical protein CSUB01_09842 [Colletotrichum sublineola]
MTPFHRSVAALVTKPRLRSAILAFLDSIERFPPLPLDIRPWLAMVPASTTERHPLSPGIPVSHAERARLAPIAQASSKPLGERRGSQAQVIICFRTSSPASSVIGARGPHPLACLQGKDPGHLVLRPYRPRSLSPQGRTPMTARPLP